MNNTVYTKNGVIGENFKGDISPLEGLVREGVKELMDQGYRGEEVAYYLQGTIALTVSSNNIRTAFKERSEATL